MPKHLRVITILAAAALLRPSTAVLATPNASDPPEQAADANAAAEFEARLAGISVHQLDDAVELAEWATDQCLFAEADGLYRAILREDRDHEVAYHALQFLSSGRPPRKESKAYFAARAAVPDSFVELETRRYVILSDADPAWVRIEGERLERAADRFHRFAADLDLRPLPLEHKLVAIVFEGRGNFLAFARGDGNRNTKRIAGYYSLPADRLVFYHVESDANIAAARGELESLYAEADSVHRASRRAGMTGQRDESRAMREDLERRLAHLDERERRLNIFAHQRSVSVTVHEAIHQLMFHTGVQSPYVDHPMWLTEGLATAFETDAPRSPFGPSREYAPRREAFWRLFDDGHLLPLRDLLTLRPDSALPSVSLSDAVYHQGYALVTWMCRHRRMEIRNYLRALDALPPGVPAAEAQVKVFEETFGDIERLEEMWLRHEGSN